MADNDFGTAVAQGFGLGEVRELRQIARGAMGAVWRLSTDTGVYAAKEPFWTAPLERDVVKEVAFRTAAAEAGVQSPEPLATPAGEYVVESWRLYEWIDGVVPDRSDVSATVWLAAQMGRIHSLAWESGQVAEPEPWYHHVDVDWTALAGKASDYPWSRDLSALVPRLEELTALVNEAPIGETVWCHRDLKNTNVLRTPDTTWLVDWDNVGPMTPWRELGALLLNHLGDEGNFSQIAAAYRDAGGTATVEEPVTFASGLAIWLNFLNGQVNATLDPELADTHRRYAEEKVLPLLHSIAGLPSWDQVRW